MFNFDIDMCVTFVNFDTRLWSNCIVNAINYSQSALVVFVYTEMFCILKSQTS